MSNLYEPKIDLYTTLLEISGFEVYQNRPEVLESLPCVTFSISEHRADYHLTQGVAREYITANVDIFANTSVETSDILGSVEDALHDLGYRLDFSADIPDPDRISHISARFNLST